MTHVIMFTDQYNRRQTVTAKVRHLNEFEVVFKLNGLLRIIDLRSVEEITPVAPVEIDRFI